MNTVEKVQYYGTGKRKTATARVFLMPGSGQFVVNQADYQDYFTSSTQQKTVAEPLQQTGLSEKFDVYVNVKGGGMTGQAGAIRMGLARALLDFDPELRPQLKKSGFLRRDPRMKERKKYGQPGARKRFQFSKR